MADRFHTDSPLAPGLVVLRGPEAHHLAASSRLRVGDRVCLFNGDGNEYPGRVVELGRRDATIEVLSVERPPRELPFALHVAAALPKGDRAQFLVEKLTELGATAFWVLNTARSVVQPREGKLDKLERTVIEASKQCGRNVLMRVEPPRSWRDFLAGPLPGRRWLAHPGGNRGDGEPGRQGDEEGVVVAVGPEGGFTDEEVAQAVAAGWGLLDLGPRILRVETAALAVAAQFGGR
jgi:16S rRNA (uracil1498-N3)-methyltransferase